MSYDTISGLFKGICDAVRAKEGSTGAINHIQIPERIMGIESGDGPYYNMPESYQIEILSNPFSCFNADEIVIIKEEQL